MCVLCLVDGAVCVRLVARTALSFIYGRLGAAWSMNAGKIVTVVSLSVTCELI